MPVVHEDRQLLLCSAQSTLTCESATTMTYLDATSASTSFDEIIDLAVLRPKRINHYSM